MPGCRYERSPIELDQTPKNSESVVFFDAAEILGLAELEQGDRRHFLLLGRLESS